MIKATLTMKISV